MFTDLCDIDAVHNVVQRLNQHGEHGRQGHRKQQLANRFGAHLVVVVFWGRIVWHKNVLSIFSYVGQKENKQTFCQKKFNH